MSAPLRDHLHAAFHRPETRVYSRVSIVVWSLIIISVGLFVAELALPAEHPMLVPLAWFDRVVLTLLSAEIALRVGSYRPPVLDVLKVGAGARLWVEIKERVLYVLNPLVLVDIISVLAVVPALRALRALRVLRLLTTLKLFRYRNPFGSITRAFADNGLLFSFALSVLGGSTILGGLSLYLAEGSQHGGVSLQDGIWWAIVTLTTVGYGDVTPATGVGRIIASFLMVVGMFTVALFAGVIGHTLLGAVLSIREEQFRVTRHFSHVVICGYDRGSEMLLATLTSEMKDVHELVIFAPGDRPHDLPEQFRWVSGDPTKESELDKVHLATARALIVVGQRAVSPQVADAVSILTTFTARAYLNRHAQARARKEKLYIVAEILDAENVQHARAAGADEVIETTKLGFSLLAHAVFHPGTAQVLSRVAVAEANSMYVMPVPAELVGERYQEAARTLKERAGVLLLGYRDGASTLERLNPPDDTLVEASWLLIYIAENPVVWVNPEE